MDTWDEKAKEVLGDPTQELVETVSPLKQMVVDYVGNKILSEGEGNEVTIEMVFSVFAEEFPEFLMALAEENFLRGYNQAVADVMSMQQQPETTEEVDNEKNEED